MRLHAFAKLRFLKVTVKKRIISTMAAPKQIPAPAFVYRHIGVNGSEALHASALQVEEPFRLTFFNGC